MISLLAFLQPFETAVVNYLKPITVTEFQSGVKGVDCIYVINLDERPEKWEWFISQEADIHVNRVSGINGWKLTSEQLQELSGSYPVRISPGQYGCLLSHISILKDAENRGFETIWVMEDDAEFLADPHQISDLLKELSSMNWDVLYTDIDMREPVGGYIISQHVDPRPGQVLPQKFYAMKRKRVSKNLMRIRNRFGTHSILVSRSGIKKMLDYFTHVYFWAHIDHDMHYIPGIREYSATRNIVTNRRITISDTGF